MIKPVHQTPDKMSRQALREKLRHKRSAISDAQRLQFDRVIRQRLLDLIESFETFSIAAYWPFDGEPDITPLFQKLVDKGFEVALPRIAELGPEMEFHAWKPESKLVKNRFGIPEPVDTKVIPLTKCQLLVMPLVGYDERGNRLGVGSGYYDRHLESMRDSWQPLRIGTAYSLQKVELLKHNDWDIPLHGVISEDGLLAFM